MVNRKFFEDIALDAAYLDTDNWPTVLIEILDESDKEKFLNRKRAVDMYLNSNVTATEIALETGIHRNHITKYVKKCLLFDDEGRIWGYRALIPQKNTVKYTRKNINTKGQKMTGSFNLLLTKYPRIKELIFEKFFNTNRSYSNEPNMRVKFLHRQFLNACRASGLSITDYPFNTKDLGRRSLYRYIKMISTNFPEKAAQRFGDDAARHLKNTGIGTKKEIPVRPFQRVEFDGHCIDLILTITFQNQYGDECTDTIERLWILVIIDVATRVILGYHICIASQYSSTDVLTCIRNAIEPGHLKELTIPGLKYSDNGGFHWQAIPDTQWALWNEFSYDNGKANLAKIVTSRLTNIVGCAVNPGPVNMPERRPFVERFFGILEEMGFHRLQNTTGSSPSDPRRGDPEKIALKYEMSVEDLEQVTAVLIANYNRTPHSGIGNLTPLEVMEQRVMKGMEPRVLAEEERTNVGFFEMTVKRTIRGSIKIGRRPYITFQGVDYRNDLVSSTFDLIGQEIILLVNTKDIRFLKAFLNDGSELGYFTATGRWGITPHSLQMRKQINALSRKKLLSYTQLDDPIEALQNYLVSKASNNKKSRTKLAATKHYRDQNPISSVDKSKDNQTNSEINEKSNFKNKQPLSAQNTDQELSALRKKFKTINI
ncbi:hypothetical protein EEL30_18340 [Brevibacillus laterosporus]|uniref:Integrase catalytic domain-containing protein n=1 Tax=Brevibacillus laterosporus TaxID=1465 RepID=A0A518VAP9_BRELA|nr:hypothetical protein EEL30_18340 [Brevibacillus laterosporus]